MVTDCLSGVQETLNTCVSRVEAYFARDLVLKCLCPFNSYNVSHDVFDFESELGWEGSNDKARGLLWHLRLRLWIVQPA